ncbi:MAG: hypothetical protein ACRDCG_02295 [Mycoplasmoidaceae bacterium]
MNNDLIYFYKSSLNLKNKIVIISIFKDLLIKYISKMFNSINIDIPYLFKNLSAFDYDDTFKRNISFDSQYFENYVKFYNDNILWNNYILKSLDISPNSGFFGLKKYFIRDSNVNINQQIETEHLILEYMVTKENANENFTINIQKKINYILNKIVNLIISKNYKIVNKFLFVDSKIFTTDSIEKKYPLWSFEDFLSNYFIEKLTLCFLSNKLNKEINTKNYDLDIIQNNISNSIYYFYYNKSSRTKSLLYKISQRPTIDDINNQLSYFKNNFVKNIFIKKLKGNELSSYIIDLNLSAIYSAIFSDFSINESSHSPLNNLLEEEYLNLKIKIL